MKLVIWDADETLWEGKIMYGKVNLKYETKEVLKQLQKLDIKQIVCSRNDLNDVKKCLDELDLTKYFDDIKASWDNKSSMIKQILKEQNIESNECLFIDDEMFNREEIRQVIGCHVDYDKDLYNIMKYFDTERLLIMKQQRTRDLAQKEFKGTFKQFLEESGTVCEILSGHPGMLTRITNLANRTNELNAARNRYTEQQILDILNDSNYLIYVATLKDKFGDYGIIGEVLIKKIDNEEWFIQDLCVSCRTMGRGVGKKLLQFAIDKAKQYDIRILTGIINNNEDNWRMSKLYEKLGFVLNSKIGNESHYYRENWMH